MFDGRAADAMKLELEVITADIGNGLQHGYALARYLRTDTISGKDNDLQLHEVLISGDPPVGRMAERCANSKESRS